jgi:hypothetical protein
MASINKGRMTAQIEGDFVVFVIGMRPNNLLKIHKWLPVVMAMGPMVKELSERPESGFLGSMGGVPFMVQYWRSFEHLTAYARNRDAKHFPAWVKFNKRVGQSGDVGIFHESFLVKAGQYESIYNSMPPTGLGRFAKLVPAVGRMESARSRAGVIQESDAPITTEGAIKY